MKNILIILISIILINSLPTQYDLRVQTTLLKYADYTLYPQGICASYAFAKELAQVVSNAVSLQTEEKMSLSAQQILECTKFKDDRCYKSTKQNILLAMKQISKNGITTNSCYKNKPLEYPGDNCRTQCDNGNPFNFIFKVNFTKYQDVLSVFDKLKASQKSAIFAIIKVDDSLNYYSSFNPTLTKQPSQIFQYRIAQVLGWKNKQKSIILRLGSGQEWGFNGYIDLDLQNFGEKYIQQFYSIELKESQNLQIQDE